MPGFSDCAASEPSPNTGTSPSVWNASHATPCGSCTQYLFDFA